MTDIEAGPANQALSAAGRLTAAAQVQPGAMWSGVTVRDTLEAAAQPLQLEGPAPGPAVLGGSSGAQDTPEQSSALPQMMMMEVGLVGVGPCYTYTA